MICSLGHRLHTFTTVPRSTQTCIPLGSLHRVPDMARVQAGMSPLSSDRMWSHMECWVPVVMWQCHTVNCYTRILYFTLRLLLFCVKNVLHYRKPKFVNNSNKCFIQNTLNCNKTLLTDSMYFITPQLVEEQLHGPLSVHQVHFVQDIDCQWESEWSHCLVPSVSVSLLWRHHCHKNETCILDTLIGIPVD